MISLRYGTPAPGLRDCFTNYYLFRVGLPEVADTTWAEMPQLRFMLSGSGVYTFGDGMRANCPDAMLVGPTNSATQFSATGPLAVFGAGLAPNGWSALVGSSAAKSSDMVEDATAIFGPIMTEMRAKMCGVDSFEDMVAIADTCLKQLVQCPVDRLTDNFIRITNAWLMGEISPRIEDLADETGLSTRQLERLANRIYGAPPKLLARKYRSLRVASRLVMNSENWQDLASEAFYDHSHFIREFKRFIGQTPRRFLLNPSPLARQMITQREAAKVIAPVSDLEIEPIDRA